jgi:hypothetical protein
MLKIEITHDGNATYNTINGNISNSAVVQGNNSSATNSNRTMTQEEAEIIKIYNSLDVKRRHKMLAMVFEFEN